MVEENKEIKREDQEDKLKRLIIKILVVIVSLILFLTIAFQPRFFTFLT